MAKWNYRIMRHVENGYEFFCIHEVFYSDEGVVEGWTDKPAVVMGESVNGVKDIIKAMLKKSSEPVIDYVEEQNGQ